MPTRTLDESGRIESRIEKREFRNNSLNNNIDTVNVEKAEALLNQKKDTLLTNNKSLAEQRKENAVMLPFVHTGRAELRFRIEKIPTNESALIGSNHWTNRSVETSPCSIILPKYGSSDEILDVNATNLELAPNFDPGRKKVNNLTVEITLKKLDRGNNASGQETNDSESTFYNSEFYPVGSNVSRIEDDRNMENRKYDRTNEMSVGSSDEDAKSRAKRNQEIKRYLRSDKNAKGSKRFKDIEQGTLIGDTKRETTGYRRTHGNRAVRSIEEIKDLAEKLIVKVRNRSIASS